MILPSKQLESILAGRCTRLLLPRGDAPGHLPPYGVGARVPLQTAASEPARGWILIGRVTDVALGGAELSQEIAELGYRDVYELQADWLERVGTWRTTDRAWLSRIAVDASAPTRFLHRDSSRGYTSQPYQALHGEKEAVDDFFLAGKSRAAHAAEDARLAAERARRPQLPLHERLRLITEDATRRDATLTPEINAIRSRISDLEQRILRPVDRTRDVEARPPEDDDTPRRRRRRLSPEAAERRRRERERRKPGPLIIRHVDPVALRPS